MNVVIVVLLVLLLIGALPTWPHMQNYGTAPAGIITVLLIVLIVLLLTGRL